MMQSNDLNDCGCCEGLNAKTPVEVINRPGLGKISYRIGTHPRFRQSMLAALSTSGQSVLHNLNTREDDDFSIALLDSLAMVADILTFYQELIANESYLRTATERVSLLHMARLIGYELRPGVAASTDLAFTLEDPAPAAKAGKIQPVSRTMNEVTIDKGTKIQSIPGPNEKPQIFETIKKIKVRPEWNDIKPRLTKRQRLTEYTNRLFFNGITTNLKAGDGVLFKAVDGNNTAVFGLVAEVKTHHEQDYTEVELKLLSSQSVYGNMPDIDAVIPPLSLIAGKYYGRTMSADDLYADCAANRFKVRDIFDNLAANPRQSPNVLVFRTHASVFGHNAPAWNTLPGALKDVEPVYTTKDDGTVVISGTKNGPYKDRKDSWADTDLMSYLNYLDLSLRTDVYLDNVYSDIVQDSTLVLKDGDKWGIFKVSGSTELSVSDFTISAKVICLTLNSNEAFNNFGIRKTTVYAQSEVLALSRIPIKEDFMPEPPALLKLDGWIDGLYAGQSIMISGEIANERGISSTECVTINRIEHVLTRDGGTRILLDKSLKKKYLRSTVTINANVAAATHGETKNEVLGSGDASQSYQSFVLRQPLLTYISASTPSGAESTLQVRVNGVLWHEVSTLYGHGPTERIYITRNDDEGVTTVRFGDGITGARLPTGQENVKATYRSGTGKEGLVKAGQLSLLMTRPLGVQEVTNPLDANGADDGESIKDARRNAPLTIQTLDRIVSMQDYEDFARAYLGIAKALATWTWDNQKRGVFVTVAGPDGAEVKTDSKLYNNLLSSMEKAGDSSIPLEVRSYKPAFFKLAATVKYDPDYQPEAVLNAVEKTLRYHFSFDKCTFGQPVILSTVIALIQAVEGVISVNMTKLYRCDDTIDALYDYLPAGMPQTGANIGAELLMLDPGPLSDLGVSR